jgi:hypothetical protein
MGVHGERLQREGVIGLQ